MSSKPLAICDFFIGRDDMDYIVEVYSTDEGWAEDYGVYVLQDDGTKGESVDTGPFDNEVQRRFSEWVLARLDDDVC